MSVKKVRVMNGGSIERALGLVSCAALTLLSGCFETRQLPAVVPATGSETSVVIGAEGGSLAIDDLLVTVPAGAIAAGTEVTVSVEAAPTEGAFTLFSPVITFEPHDVALAHPIEIRIPFRGDTNLANVYVERSGGGAFVPRTTQISGDVAIAEMDYLASSAFVGTACEGEECTCEPNGRLDLLVVMDDSSSMAEEQALIRAQLPDLFRALATGDLDGDGAQDVPAFDSIRVGVTTSDMGSGVATGIVSCAEGLGGDGLLRSDRGADADASCTVAEYGSPIAEYSASMPTELDGFVSQVSCTGARGVGGCGFEQQLEAALTALSPNAPTAYTSSTWTVPMYADGRVGQGDMGNAGFLRDDSILAIVWVTDEEDCSTTDSGIFSRDNPAYSAVDLNLRCYSFPEVLQAPQRFVDGIIGLRGRPEDIVVAAITGTPVMFPATPGAIDYDALLADEAMREVVDSVTGNRLQPSCSSPNGTASPPRRIVQTLRGIDESGARVVMQSICESDFGSVTHDLATQLGERAAGGC
jgi:hypothetical protein